MAADDHFCQRGEEKGQTATRIDSCLCVKQTWYPLAIFPSGMITASGIAISWPCRVDFCVSGGIRGWQLGGKIRFCSFANGAKWLI
jgi:hypothetical protein